MWWGRAARPAVHTLRLAEAFQSKDECLVAMRMWNRAGFDYAGCAIFGFVVAILHVPKGSQRFR
jgi:hypothetical protein